MSEQKIYTARHIFTGDRWLKDHAIITENGLIKNVVPSSPVLTVTGTYDTLLPAFIDLQIYGASGKLFSVFPEPATLSLIHNYCKEGGAFFFQPTVATNTVNVVHNCIDAVKQYWEQNGQGCLGLHVEGPWINTEKRGAHIKELVHSPTVEEVTKLLEYGKGVIKMITLAPEVCSDEVIDIILQYGIAISAGHSNISYADANNAFRKGITTVTHLYNAMSGLAHREPGLVGAAFLNNNVMASIIPDGHHVDFAAVSIAAQLMQERLFIITDAVTDTTSGHYQHHKEGDKYVAAGILSGSALTMIQGIKNMIIHGRVDKTTAIKMSCVYPARAVNLENSIGKIEKGLSACFVATDEELGSVKVIA